MFGVGLRFLAIAHLPARVRPRPIRRRRAGGPQCRLNPAEDVARVFSGLATHGAFIVALHRERTVVVRAQERAEEMADLLRESSQLESCERGSWTIRGATVVAAG